MKRKISMLLLGSMIPVAIFTGCGGGDSAVIPSNDGTGTSTGTFLDAAVAGADYNTSSGINGTTDDKGTFRYNAGDSVTFKVGDIILGDAKPDPNGGLVTPKDLAKDDNETTALIAQILQTLDSDENPNNGIKIDTKKLKVKSVKKIADIKKTTLSDLFEDNVTIVPADEALAHLNESLKKWDEEHPTTATYLFYGEVNAASLGRIKNVRVFDPQDPKKALVKDDSIVDIGRPAVETVMDYNATNQTYKNLHMTKMCYYSDEEKKAYTVSMLKGATGLQKVQNSSATNLSDPDYDTIDYLGKRVFLTAHNDDTNKTVLITPDMDEKTAPIDFGDRSLLSVTYPAYGEKIDGYLVYNNDTKKVQKCSLDMTQCSDIDGLDVDRSRDFEGDIGGTVYSVFVNKGTKTIYKLNKATGDVTSISMGDVNILVGHGTTSFKGDSYFFIGEDHNLYRVDVTNEKVNKITPSADDTLERIRAVDRDYVFYGSDTILKAAKKDGSTTNPILLAKTTKTGGYKYVKDFGYGDKFIYQLYEYKKDSNNGYEKTIYNACIFEGGKTQCKENSFWGGVILANNGKMEFTSTMPYEPVVYVRVDDTDDFGGGTLKSVDINSPMGDGITLGKVDKYNFQTFLSNSTYRETTIDGPSGVVLYAKNDDTFHVDAFYLNRKKENSLVQLTDTNPFPDVTSGRRDHCHGRVCMICHNLAGGKIYQSKKGAKSAYGYRAKLLFEDGSSVLADIAKGKGENFSIPLKKIKGNFKAEIVDVNGTVLNSSVGYYHEGVDYTNCNYCHGRYGATRYGAPGAITWDSNSTL